MLRGTREDHLRFLLRWFDRLEASTRHASLFDIEVLGPDAMRRHEGAEVIAIRMPEDEGGRLLALIELDGLAAHVTYCRPENLGLVRTAIARLKETLGGKP